MEGELRTGFLMVAAQGEASSNGRFAAVTEEADFSGRNWHVPQRTPGAFGSIQIAQRRREPSRLTVVPEVTALTLPAAERELEAADLGLGRVNEAQDGNHEPDTIVRQRPAPGTQVAPGTKVQVWVARGRPGRPRFTVVPEVITLTLPVAERELEAADLGLGRVNEVQDRNHEPNTIVRQRPAPGTQVAPGTKVEVWVARGRPGRPRFTVVPEVTALTLPAAEHELEAADLGLGRVNEVQDRDHVPGTVVRQQPAPGTQVAPGTKVEVWVAQRKSSFPVWAGIAVLLVLLQLLFRWRNQKPKETVLPALRIEASKDPGQQAIEPALSQRPIIDVRFRTTLDSGEQTVNEENRKS
jgi:beta-lactam-binding protein with PASTA domain